MGSKTPMASEKHSTYRSRVETALVPKTSRKAHCWYLIIMIMILTVVIGDTYTL